MMAIRITSSQISVVGKPRDWVRADWGLQLLMGNWNALKPKPRRRLIRIVEG